MNKTEHIWGILVLTFSVLIIIPVGTILICSLSFGDCSRHVVFIPTVSSWPAGCANSETKYFCRFEKNNTTNENRVTGCKSAGSKDVKIKPMSQFTDFTSSLLTKYDLNVQILNDQPGQPFKNDPAGLADAVIRYSILHREAHIHQASLIYNSLSSTYITS